jgi:hypothetical protein
MTELGQLNSKIFSEHLHTKFHIKSSDGASIPLELFEVEERALSPKVELFFLRFRGPGAPHLPQQIHRFEHEVLGDLDMFVTATGTSEQGIEYEVVFNRMRPKA